MVFRIYYADGTVFEGRDKSDWLAAPDDGVQAVVRFPMRDGLGWSCRGVVVRDRDLWTGTNEYDPFGWGVKTGSLLPDADYFAIWDRACGDL